MTKTGKRFWNSAEIFITMRKWAIRNSVLPENLWNLWKSGNLPVTKDLAITGAKAYLNREKAENVSLALLGELDALRIPQHAHANPETQAAHCCGHHTQMAGVIGAALALTDPEVAAALDGQVIFFAVPAEEYGEVEFKNTLIAENKIQYGGGKCELLRIGAFEDISLCLAHHTGYNGISLVPAAAMALYQKSFA